MCLVVAASLGATGVIATDTRHTYEIAGRGPLYIDAGLKLARLGSGWICAGGDGYAWRRGLDALSGSDAGDLGELQRRLSAAFTVWGPKHAATFPAESLRTHRYYVLRADDGVAQIHRMRTDGTDDAAGANLLAGWPPGVDAATGEPWLHALAAASHDGLGQFLIELGRLFERASSRTSAMSYAMDIGILSAPDVRLYRLVADAPGLARQSVRDVERTVAEMVANGREAREGPHVHSAAEHRRLLAWSAAVDLQVDTIQHGRS